MAGAPMAGEREGAKAEEVKAGVRVEATVEVGAARAQTVNESLMRDVRAHYLNPELSPFPGEESPLLPEISRYLTTAGIHNPIAQIYVTTDAVEHLPALVFLFTLTQLPKYAYDPHLSTIAPRARSKGAVKVRSPPRRPTPTSKP